MDLFVARQPILDRQQRVYAYELMFRSGGEPPIVDSDESAASRKTLDEKLEAFGFPDLTQGQPGFLKFTRSLATQQTALLLPSDKVIVEILDEVEPDDEILTACRALRRGGYHLAFDDFVGQHGRDPLISVIDIVKIDFHKVVGPKRRLLAERLKARRVKLLAERVETSEDFLEGLTLGYDLFQGYFLCRPEIVPREDIPGNKLAHLRFLREINQPELDYGRLEQLLKQDVALPVKLLRYVNSAWFGLAGRVDSLRHALALLGAKGLRQWASLIAVSDLGRDKPPALIATCLFRAAFCERLARPAGLEAETSNLFLVGLFSALDALVGRPLDELLGEVAVPDQVRGTLLGQPSPLQPVYQLALAYERGEWPQVTRRAKDLSIDEALLPAAYGQSVQWAGQVMSA